MRNHVAFVLIMAMMASLVTVPAQAGHRWHPRVTTQVDTYHGSELEYGIESVASIPRGITQGLARDLCNNNRGTGNQMEYSWCYGQVTNSWGQVVDRNPYAAYPNAYQNPNNYRPSSGNGSFGWRSDGYFYDNYDRRYRRGNNDTLELVGGLVAGGIVGAGVMALTHKGGKSNDSSPAKCVEQMLKSFRNAKQAVTSEQVMAMCTGQPIPSAPAPAATPVPAPVPAPEQTLTVPVRATEVMVVNKTATHECVIIDGKKTDYNVGQMVNMSKFKAGTMQGSTCKLKAEWTAQGTLELICSH